MCGGTYLPKILSQSKIEAPDNAKALSDYTPERKTIGNQVLLKNNSDLNVAGRPKFCILIFILVRYLKVMLMVLGIIIEQPSVLPGMSAQQPFSTYL